MIHKHLYARFHRHTISFKHAFAGIIWSLKTQPNYLVHFLLSLIALGASYYYQISYIEFLIILTLIFIGLAIETLNTAIEKVCDAVTMDFNEHIKIAKDVAAGAMLFFAFGAWIIASIIFLPHIFG